MTVCEFCGEKLIMLREVFQSTAGHSENGITERGAFYCQKRPQKAEKAAEQIAYNESLLSLGHGPRGE